MIRLVDIDPDNWRLGLQVAEHQRKFVSSAPWLLARAYGYRNYRSNAFVIYDDETPVGMGLYYDCPDMEAYNFSQLFIDERYQRKGYGKAAIKLVLDAMQQDGKYKKVVICYIEGNEASKNLYGRFGFVQTHRDGDEIIMELELTK